MFSARYLKKILSHTAFVCLLICPYAGKTQSYIDSLKTSLTLETNDSLRVLSGMHLSRAIHKKKEHSEKEEKFYAKNAVELARTLKDTLLYARALNNLGLLYRYHQHYEEAIPLHINAFNLIKDEKGISLYKMIFANNAGVAARYAQKYDQAIAFYMKALKIAKRENDLKNIAISSNGIGNVLGNISGREEEALGYFEESLNAEEVRGNSLGIAMNYLSISSYYITNKQFAKARDYLNKLYKINQTRKDQYGLAITYEFYGKCYLEEGKNLVKAASYLQNALHRFQKMKDTHKQADIFNILGDVQLKRNQIKQAKESYLNSLTLADKIDHQGLIMNNSYKLAQIFEKENKPSEALQYFKQGQVYKDSMNLSEQKIQIASLIRKYNMEQKENFIQLLQKDKALQQTLLDNQKQKLDRRRLFIILMGIGILLVITIILLQYRNARTKRETNALVQKEEKGKTKAIYERNLAQAEALATRLKINPHFIFNSLNAIKYLIQSEQNQKAMKYLVEFSRYTRMVLEISQKPVITLAEELQLTRYYLTLEKNRFEKDFTYEVEVHNVKELDGIFIPPMLLQPFIENAIWHGLLPSKRDEKTLLINTASENNHLKIIIDDNGVGRKNAKPQTLKKLHKSMGMQIINDRISHYNKSYNSSITCDITDKLDEDGQAGGTRIIICISRSGENKNDQIPAGAPV